MKKLIFLAITALATALTLKAQSDSLKITSDFGVLTQVEGLYSNTGKLYLNTFPGGGLRAEYGNWFAGGKLNAYIGNDTLGGSNSFRIPQMKLFVGRKIGNNELMVSLGKIRREEDVISNRVMTGTAVGHSASFAFGVLAIAPKAAMLEYGNEKFRAFAGYYEPEEDFLLKFFGSGTVFAGGNVSLWKDILYLSGGLDRHPDSYSGFGAIRIKAGNTSVMAEGRKIGIQGDENLILNVNQKIGKFTLAAEGHLKEDYKRGLLTIHTPQRIWVGGGYQEICGQKSALLSIGYARFFSLL